MVVVGNDVAGANQLIPGISGHDSEGIPGNVSHPRQVLANLLRAHRDGILDHGLAQECRLVRRTVLLDV